MKNIKNYVISANIDEKMNKIVLEIKKNTYRYVRN